jgi:hypothetical protein
MNSIIFFNSLVCISSLIIGWVSPLVIELTENFEQPILGCPPEEQIQSSSDWQVSISSSSSLDSQNSGFLGKIGGKHSGIAIHENYAYVGFGSIIKIFDVSIRTSPYLVGQVNSHGETIRNIFIGGSYAYVVDEFSKVKVFNLQDPLRPIDITPSPFISAIEIRIIGNLAYVGHDYDFYIYQINTPFSLTQLSVIHKPGIVRSFYTQGDFAYLAVGGVGLSIINIANPKAPKEVGFYPTTYSLDVAVSGDYAYIAAY